MDPFELDAREAWNAGADAFIAFVDSGADHYRHRVHGPALLAACGDVRGAAVLDVGCGHGYFSRQLAKAGASVTGVDVSDALLTRAAEVEARERLGIAYVRLDAAEIATRFEAGRFDRVTGCMSVQDVDDLAGLLAGARRVLKPGGRMTFSVPHPCTDLPVRVWERDELGRKQALCLDRYFDTGPAVCHWTMPRLKYHWSTPYRRLTLTEWSDAIRDAGLTIRAMSEPRPDEAEVAAHPELEDCARMPFFLIFDLGKGA